MWTLLGKVRDGVIEGLGGGEEEEDGGGESADGTTSCWIAVGEAGYCMKYIRIDQMTLPHNTILLLLIE